MSAQRCRCAIAMGLAQGQFAGRCIEPASVHLPCLVAAFEFVQGVCS